jgi:hypothetical protein
MFAVEFEPVSVEDVKHLLKLETVPVFHKAGDPFKALRRKEAAAPLEGYAISWMAKLPREVQPRVTGQKYARIVNRLAALWSVEDRAYAYLRELSVDTRGSRQGFPKDVSKELNALRAHLTQNMQTKISGAWALEPVSRA